MNTQQHTNPPLLPKPKVTFRLLHQDEIAMGPGKAELLAAIQQTGSISAAGKTMNMSYRRAWMLVDVMNRCFKQPLVQTAKGGKDGGGAKLTPLGKQVLENYQHAMQAINHTVQAYLPLFADVLNSQPTEPHQKTDIAENALDQLPD
ncbi:winged helix-turn-helix domain-containing protein [Methylomonas paludis]|nr:LysR family transcriptional regulator [Methylomonas paludis]